MGGLIWDLKDLIECLKGFIQGLMQRVWIFEAEVC